MMTGTGMSRQHQAGPTKKQLVIKPLKLKPQLPDNFEINTWSKLQVAVHAVQQHTSVSCSLEELYRAVEDMCLHKLAPKLYDLLKQECDRHSQEQISILVGKLGLRGAAFLEQLCKVWEGYCSQLLLTRQIFLYLDRTYVVSCSGVRSLFDMGLQLFAAHLQARPEVEGKIMEGLLQQIHAERNGEPVDRQLLQHLMRMLTSLGLYEEQFQRLLLHDTAMFYEVEGERLMQEVEVPVFLSECERRLAEEYSRCDVYLEPCTRKTLVATVEQYLVARHFGTVLDRGFEVMLAQNRLEDLARLYSLCLRINALEALRVAFRNFIRNTGSRIVLDEEKDGELVQSLLDMKKKLDEVLEGCFQKNDVFASTIKEGFEHFINQRANKPAELIAKYIDLVMRGGSKAVGAVGEDEVESTLDRALVLFRYIQGKDVFEAFYKKDLAKRLLLGKSANHDAEKAMIAKLKAECGSQFTNKLEGMFKDIDLSREIMGSFRQSAAVSSQIPSGLDLNVHILTSGFWPSYPLVECNLPEQLSSAQQVFKDFYLSKHSGRRLVWYNSLGSCVIKARFNQGPRELQVSLCQAVVLMLFLDCDQLSFDDIKAASNLEDKELRRTLQSLACGKERVLQKEPKGKEVEDGDVFHFNATYSSRLYRVKINSIQLKESAEENKKTNDQVLQDRQYQIDAAIVRIMKMRKTLSHKLLVNELMTQLKFPIRAADLKKRIESLIDREYLERDERDSQIYNYLA